MTLGTKTLLFGVHQIFIHTIMVTWAWRRLYKSWPNWREFVCICIHDIGYWGKPSLKDADGDKHPEFGAKLAGWMFGPGWRDFCLGHSSFYVHRNGIEASKLMAADKYWHCMIPLWFYKILAVPTGEFAHYRGLQHVRQVASIAATDEEWWSNLQRICEEKVAGVYEIGANIDGGEK